MYNTLYAESTGKTLTSDDEAAGSWSWHQASGGSTNREVQVVKQGV